MRPASEVEALGGTAWGLHRVRVQHPGQPQWQTAAMTLLLPAPSRPRPSLDPPYTWEPVGVDAMGTLTAAAADASTGGGPWRAIATFEGLRTTDGREINGLSMRPLPLPLMAVDITTRGHQMARLAGRIETLERREGGVIYAEGTYADTEWGRYIEGLVGDQMLRWDSIDLEILHWEWVVDGLDDDGWESYLLRVTEANAMGLTVLPFPAFARAVIVNGDTSLDTAADQASTAAVGLGLPGPRPLTIAASGRPEDLPPAGLFADPGFDRLTHTVVEDVPGTSWRRFYGHLADWSTPHIGVGNGDVFAPRSLTDYGYFRTGTTPVATPQGPSTVRTGVLSLGGGHADTRLGWRPATQHYDDASFGAADVVVGEDRFGPWVAGVLRPETTYEQARVIRASDLSGDWRRIAALGNLELVAILCVNVAGFPVVDRALAASASMADVVDFCAAFARGAGGEEEVQTLVAAGMLRSDPVSTHLLQLRREVSALKAIMEPLRGLSLERLAAFARSHLAGVSEKSWDGSASRFSDTEYKRACAACKGQSEAPKTDCFLPHHEPDGTLNRAGVHAAASRFGSVKAPDDAKSRAASHLRGHYKTLGEDAPDSIK